MIFQPPLLIFPNICQIIHHMQGVVCFGLLRTWGRTSHLVLLSYSGYPPCPRTYARNIISLLKRCWISYEILHKEYRSPYSNQKEQKVLQVPVSVQVTDVSQPRCKIQCTSVGTTGTTARFSLLQKVQNCTRELVSSFWLVLINFTQFDWLSNFCW